MATGDPVCPIHGMVRCRCRELGLLAGVDMTGNFTVLTPEKEERLRKLEEFYREVRRIANSADLHNHTNIYKALSKIDPRWNEGPN